MKGHIDIVVMPDGHLEGRPIAGDEVETNEVVTTIAVNGDAPATNTGANTTPHDHATNAVGAALADPHAHVLTSFDAKDWVEAFNVSLVSQGLTPLDKDMLFGWFANALMRGYDEGKKPN